MKWRDASLCAIRRAADKWAEDAIAEAQKPPRWPYEQKARAVAEELGLRGVPVLYLHQTPDGQPVPWADAEGRQRPGALMAESARSAGVELVRVHVRHQPGCPILDGPTDQCTCAAPAVVVERREPEQTL